jgi:putative membrane protein
MTDKSQTPAADVGTELAMRRTGMSFQRTRMSADRTLMSIIRTSLSLISFGFTIYQVFNKLKDSGVITGAAASRHFGVALVLLGIGLLALGIVYHLMFMRGLRMQRNEMHAQNLIHAQSQFPPSLTLISALALLAIGCVLILGLLLKIGPFG